MGKIAKFAYHRWRGLGQVINNKKSSLFFSTNTSAKAKQKVIQAVGGTICGNYDQYLSLATLIGRSKNNSFGWIKETVW